MLAGHETVSKSVRTMFSLVVSGAVLINSPADLWTLGVGQTPGFPGETACRGYRDSGQGQGEG